MNLAMAVKLMVTFEFSMKKDISNYRSE